jgi:SAM-dependent methyltransferase
VTDAWSDRAGLYRTSAAHAEGADLDLIVEWAAGAHTALDVATGGGHVARRLREAGLEVVTVDPAPGMRPDVIAVAENLPFADSGFDLTVTRVAAHHFDDVRAAVHELARVAAHHVLIVDNLNLGDEIEKAEKIRDPSHVRNYHEDEWREFARAAGLVVDEVRILEHAVELEPWLERTDCTGADAAIVRSLLAPRLRDGWILFERIALRASKPPARERSPWRS